MQGYIKIFGFCALAIGLFFMLNSCSANKLAHRFGEDVQRAVQSYGTHDQAKQKVEEAIWTLAKKHDITLAENAIKIKSSRTNLDKTGWSQIVFLTATVTYEHQIMPFYSTKYKIIRSLHR